MDGGWHSSLSMAERLSATMKIMAKCKRAYPDLDKGELRKKAQSIEETTFKEASSSDDYQKRYENAISALPLPPSSSPPGTTTADNRLAPSSFPTERIGPYAATYHASGLFSTIYRSTLPDGITVAIKLTTPSTSTAPHNPHREARLLRLAVHRTIVPLLDTHYIAGGHFLLTLPFLPYDLSSLLSSHHTPALTPVQARSHLHALFSALAHIHSQGILHRDVKPSNVLLASTNGPAYLADFGIAWREGDRDSEPREEKITDVGTTCYRAPELLFGYGAYGEGIDLWAAGCVLAEAERGGRSLFEAGDVGSELALIKSVFETLGTPDEGRWPESKKFPDWGRLQFTEYPAKEWMEILPNASDRARDLVSRLVTYESGERLSAAEVLKHPYFEVEDKKAI